MFLYFYIITCAEKKGNDSILKSYLEDINDLETTKRNIEDINQPESLQQSNSIDESHDKTLLPNINYNDEVNPVQTYSLIKNSSNKRKVSDSFDESNSVYSNSSSESLEKCKPQKTTLKEPKLPNQEILNTDNGMLCSSFANSQNTKFLYPFIPTISHYQNQQYKFINTIQSHDNTNNLILQPIRITHNNQIAILRSICNNNRKDYVIIFDPEIPDLNELCINLILAFFCSKIPLLDNGLLIIKTDYKHLIYKYDEFYPFLYYLNYHRRDKNEDTYPIKIAMFNETLKILKLYFSNTEILQLRNIIHEILQNFISCESIADIYLTLCNRNFKDLYKQNLSIKPLKALFFVFFFVNYEEVNPNFEHILKQEAKKSIKKILNKGYVLGTFFDHFETFIAGIGLKIEEKNSLISLFADMDNLEFRNESKISLKNVRESSVVSLQGVEVVYKILEQFQKVIK